MLSAQRLRVVTGLILAALLVHASAPVFSAPVEAGEPPYSYRYHDELIVMKPSESLIAFGAATPESNNFAASAGLERDLLSDDQALRSRGLSLYRISSGPKGQPTPHSAITAAIEAKDAGLATQPVFYAGDFLEIPFDEVIVSFQRETGADTAESFFGEQAGDLGIVDLRYLRPNTFIVRISDPENGRAFAVSRALAAIPGVSYAEPNFIMVRLKGQAAPMLEEQRLPLNVAPLPLEGEGEFDVEPSPEQTPATPVGWTTVLTAGFDAGAPGWAVYVLGVDAQPVLQNLHTHSGTGAIYMTGGGSQGIPAPGPYPNNVNTYLASPVLDLGGYEEAYAELWFYAKYENPNNADPSNPIYYDSGSLALIDFDSGIATQLLPLAVAYTGDLTVDPTTQSGWRRALFRVPPQFRKANVALGINFVSDSLVAAEGLYIDDIRVVATAEVDTEPLGNDTYGAREYELKNSGQIAALGEDANDMNVPEAWGLVSVSDQIVVAVIDSGVELTHPDLNLVTGYDASTGAVGGGSDGDAHGTACAGNVGARLDNGIGTIGTAADVKIMPIYHGGNSAFFASGIDLAVQHGADVLSNSWGWVGSPSATIEAAIQDALAAGRTVVFAAGNGPDRPPYTYDTAFPCNLTDDTDLICVGASSPTDEHKNASSSDGQFSWGSSYVGAGPDVVAPGPWSYTTDLLGIAGYNTDAAFTGVDTDYTHDFGGTSSSTPKVAGIAALLLSKNPDLTPHQVKAILRDTAHDIDVPGVDDRTGAGRVDAFAAVSAVPMPGTLLLTVAKDGTGSGTVASSPDGIDCGSDCIESYASGTSVALTATPASGSTFSGWSGACAGTSTCVLSMTEDRSVTATFASPLACGIDWQLADPLPDEILAVNSVTYGNDRFVAAAGYEGGFLTSPDGLTWTWRELFGTQIYSDVTWGGNQFVAVKNQDYASPAVRTSPDGITWTGHDPGILGGLGLFGVSWNGFRYVAVGGIDALSLFATSPDGVTWSNSTTEGGELRGVSWSGSQFVAVGKSPYLPGLPTQAPIFVSSDGVNWNPVSSGIEQDLYDVTWGNDQFVAVGNANEPAGVTAAIWTSPDGVNWTWRNSGTMNDLRSVTWGGSQFVAVGLNGTILISPDGVSWALASSGTTSSLSGVTWGGDRFVAVGALGTILMSPCDTQYSLDVTRIGDGTVISSPPGIDCGTDCTESYASGASVTLTATPASGWSFAGWSGDCFGTGTCVLSMTSDKSVTATFAAIPRYVLTVTRVGEGAVTSNPIGIDCGTDCTESYVSGTSVTLTAAAANDWSFSGWSGACAGTGGTCVVSMTSDKGVIATFSSGAPPVYLGEGEAEANHTWTYIDAASGYLDAVVLAGPPTYHGGDPGVVRLRNVSDTGFELRFQEWDYRARDFADISHAYEDIPYVVLQPGRHLMSDGSEWEVGTFALGGTGTWKGVLFGAPFTQNPKLFLTVQTYNGNQAVSARARAVTPDGFEAALFEEEALMDGHSVETIGYLAIDSPTGGGLIDLDGTQVPYLLQSLSGDERWNPVLSQRLKVEEEKSNDSEVGHVDETLHLLALDNQILAQQVTSNGWDPTALRRLEPTKDATLEWGLIRGIDHNWQVLPFAKDYTTPVLIAKPVSNNGADPGVIRIRDVTSTEGQLRYQEWNNYLDGTHGAAEDVFYLVSEAGEHTLAGLTVEADSLITNKLGRAGQWEGIQFNAFFTADPTVFTSVMTYNGADTVTTRIRNLDPAGFDLAMDEQESKSDGHTYETLGWIAIATGTATTSDGRKLQVFFDQLDGTLTVVPYPRTTSHRLPTVVGDVDSTFGADPVFLRYANPTNAQIELKLSEEQSQDTETDHVLEDVGVFVGE